MNSREYETTFQVADEHRRHQRSILNPKAQRIFLFLLISLLAMAFLHTPGTDDVNSELVGLRN